MDSLRAALHRWTIVAIAAWSLLILFIETFKGSGVGGPRCLTDPTCGEVGWVPTVVWIGGIVLILGLGFALRPGGRQGTTTTDKIIGIAIALGILVLVGVALTLYQDIRTNA